MSSRVNTKQRIATAGTVFFFILAIFLANEAPVAWSLLPFVLGLICFAGVWATGLTPKEYPDKVE